MVKDKKIVLHAHHSFYNPDETRKARLDEKAYNLFFPIPNLRRIVDNIFERNIGICALSVCHTPTSGNDPGFQNYMKQLSSLDVDYETEMHLDEGWFAVERSRSKIVIPENEARQINRAIILYTQEVRTDYKGKPADINVLCVNREIGHSTDTVEAARIGREEGGIVTLCHPNSIVCSLGLDKAMEMLSNKQVHAIEAGNATESREVNDELNNALKENGITGPVVSDSHHYSQVDAAYALFDEKLWRNFSRQGLAQAITNGEYENHMGYISSMSKFTHHTLPILASIPGHLIRNPGAIIKSLKKSD